MSSRALFAPIATVRSSPFPVTRSRPRAIEGVTDVLNGDRDLEEEPLGKAEIGDRGGVVDRLLRIRGRNIEERLVDENRKILRAENPDLR